MNEIEDIHEAILSYPETGVSEPFGPEVLVYKVVGKVVAIMAPERVPVMLNLKCDPERALDLRDEYASIKPGYHMNKRHWNSVYLDGSIPDKMILELVRHSFDCVTAKHPKTVRQRIQKQLKD